MSELSLMELEEGKIYKVKTSDQSFKVEGNTLKCEQPRGGFATAWCKRDPNQKQFEEIKPEPELFYYWEKKCPMTKEWGLVAGRNTKEAIRKRMSSNTYRILTEFKPITADGKEYKK